MYFQKSSFMAKKMLSAIEIVLMILIAAAIIFKCAISYQIGLGRADITGPPVEIHFVS